MGSFKSVSLLDLKKLSQASKLAQLEEKDRSKELFFKNAEQLDVHSVFELWHDCDNLSDNSSNTSLSKLYKIKIL